MSSLRISNPRSVKFFRLVENIAVGRPVDGVTVTKLRLPGEALGAVQITLTGVKTGSEVHIYNNARIELGTGVESSEGNVVLTLSYYAPGSENNTIRIFVTHLNYENVDITYVLPQVNSSIPVFQRIDRNYRNLA